MTEQKRPVLTLKRKTEVNTPVRSRKTIINLTTPPKWKVKKQQLAEKALCEAERAKKKEHARKALAGYVTVLPLEEAVSTLKTWWPALFEGNESRLLACGIREMLYEDVAVREIPLSRKRIIRSLRAITRSEAYLMSMKAGAGRYNPHGEVTGHITVDDEAYAQVKLENLRKQNQKKLALMAVLSD